MRNFFTALLGALAALSAAPAFAQDTVPPTISPAAPASPAPPIFVNNPVWARQPAPDYPELALDMGIEAWVRVECDMARATGVLSACRPLAESFPGMGFQSRAVAASNRARAAVASLGGDGPAVTTARFNLIFVMPPEDPPVGPPAWSGRAPTPEVMRDAKSAVSAQTALPPDFFIARLPTAWSVHRDQVHMEFDAEAREVWALALARAGDSRRGREDILAPGVQSGTARLEIWGRRQPEAFDLQRRMKARLRELMCQNRTCTMPRRNAPRQQH